jgi:hypothetical protein
MEKGNRSHVLGSPTRFEQNAHQIEQAAESPGGDVFVEHVEDIAPKLPSTKDARGRVRRRRFRPLPAVLVGPRLVFSDEENARWKSERESEYARLKDDLQDGRTESGRSFPSSDGSDEPQR